MTMSRNVTRSDGSSDPSKIVVMTNTPLSASARLITIS